MVCVRGGCAKTKLKGRLLPKRGKSLKILQNPSRLLHSLLSLATLESRVTLGKHRIPQSLDHRRGFRVLENCTPPKIGRKFIVANQIAIRQTIPATILETNIVI